MPHRAQAQSPAFCAGTDPSSLPDAGSTDALGPADKSAPNGELRPAVVPAPGISFVVVVIDDAGAQMSPIIILTGGAAGLAKIHGPDRPLFDPISLA